MSTLERLAAALADRYTIERELGAGGMATVYLAQDLKHDRQVAIKVLKPELAAVLGADRFVVEIKTTAALQHPHILPLFDSGSADGFLFYVMPFIQGETLRSKLDRETQFGIDEAVRIARDVADALDYAHRNGVVHRDIKPENILLHDGRPMVADFGIALALSAAAGGRMTETGMSLGTPHYMSPEQATADKEISGRSDIYSLGSVLYEMLAGNPPHVGNSAQQIIMKIIAESVEPVTKYRKSVPPNVAAAVAQALEKLPADRFESAKAFAEALGNTAFTTMHATSVGGGVGGRSFKRAFIAMSVVAAVALVAAGVAWFRSAPEPLVTRQHVQLWPHGVGGLAWRLAISPDGGAMVYWDTVGGTPQLWLKERDRLDATPLAGTTGAGGPTFSPDGESIAFVAEGKVKRVPRLGGSAITVAESANTALPAIAWLDDGTILFNDPEYRLRAISVDGGATRGFPELDSQIRGVVVLTPLPGGRGALVTSCTGGCVESDLRAIDLRSGEVRILADDGLQGWYVASGNVVFVRRDGGVFSAPFDLKTLAFHSAPVPVLNGVRANAASADMVLAPNGTLVYVAGSAVGRRGVEAVWVTREGVASLVDSSWTFVEGSGGGVALSPTGDRLAVSAIASGGEDIWIKQLPAGPFTRLSFTGSNGRPFWTADGRSVAYITNKEAGELNDLVMQRADGSGAPVMILDGERSVHEAIRTPDTTRFVVRLTGPSDDLHVVTRAKDSAATIPLVASERFNERMPALSPDGRYLAYSSDESGRFEVFVRPYPNADGGKWQVSRDGGEEARWSHSGRELFYRNGKRELVAANVTLGATFVLGEQRALFSTAGYVRANSNVRYDVAPDDRRFVFLRFVGTGAGSGGASADPLTVIKVDNWLTELKAGGARR